MPTTPTAAVGPKPVPPQRPVTLKVCFVSKHLYSVHCFFNMPTVLEYIGEESVGGRFLFCLKNQANYFVDWTCTDLRMSLQK